MIAFHEFYVLTHSHFFSHYRTHSHTELVTLVRNSRYFQNIPVLDVECAEMDGDVNTMPIVFEDVFCEGQTVKQCELFQG